MRFLFSLILWILLVGGLWLYTWQRDNALEGGGPERVRLAEATEEYSLELTPTFNIEKDPFALQLDDRQAAALEVRINGVLVEVGEEPIQRGKVLRLEQVKHLVLGSNELHLKGSPPAIESGVDHGIRVRLLQAGGEIVDKTIWSSQGALVSGTVSFHLEARREADHDH